MFCKNGVLRNFAKFTGLKSQACNFIKTETLAQVFSSEFCEISKNIFFYRTPPVAASVYIFVSLFISWKIFHQSNLPLQSGKNGVIFFISVRFDFISTKWKTFHRCHLFPWNAKKLSNFLQFFIHISFHFHEVDCISPTWFISRKWKIFHQRTVYPSSE